MLTGPWSFTDADDPRMSWFVFNMIIVLSNIDLLYTKDKPSLLYSLEISWLCQLFLLWDASVFLSL